MLARGAQLSPTMLMRRFRLEGARIGGLLDAEGGGPLATVWMVDAQVGGQADLSDARLPNPTGATLVANRLGVTGDLFMRGAFVYQGTSAKSLSRLTSARLGGLEIFSGVQLANSAGPALALQNATAEWVRLPAELLCAPDARGCCGTFTRKDGRLTGMEFFLPVTSEDEYEQRYVELARFAGAAVPVPEARLWSVRWEHGGEVWEATVGELLVRVKPAPRVQDSAAVMAIFPGNPYLIVTSAQPLTSLRSGWHNPISAGVPQVRKSVPFDT